MTDLADRIAGLSPAKRALLERRLLERRGQDSARIRPRAPGEPPVLSFGQQRLWFLEQLDPDSPLYIVPSAQHIRGPLEVDALRRAFETIVRRHEVLRTRIELLEGVPRPVIDPTGGWQLPLRDLSTLAPAEQQAELQHLIDSYTGRHFDLAHELPLRALLVRLDHQEHVLVSAWHHIASDAWSAGVFARELGALYGAFAAGEPSPLGELPIQYADFARWQRERLGGELLATQLAYWREQLDGSPPALDLPTDRRRPQLQTYNGAEETLLVPAKLAVAMHELSRELGATLFMTLLAAWKVLLWRYSEQDDILIGVPVAGRSAVETEGLIGLFLNTLVLRTRLQPEASFRELLEEVRKAALGAFAHQELPFERLVEELHVERDPSRTPLFGVQFNLRNVVRPPLALAGLALTPLATQRRIAKYDLSLAVDEGPQGLLLQLEYNTDLWERATILRMLHQLRYLLAAAAAEPALSIARLPLEDAAEHPALRRLEHHARMRHGGTGGAESHLTLPASGMDPAESTLASTAAGGRAQPAATAPIVQLWHERLAADPGATAFVWGEQTTSYAELDRRADGAAQQLRAAGARPGAVVGVCLERSLDAVVAFLAVLKVGGVYLPLDPALPTARLQAMVADSGAEIVVGRRDSASLGVRPVAVDEASGGGRREVSDHIAAPGEAAYIIYTSGSSGEPKGVLVEHRAILDRLGWLWQAHPYAPGEVGCHKTAVGFVDAIAEMLGPLLQGVPSLIVPDDVVRDPPRLVTLLARHGVTRIWLVPSLVRALLDSVPALAARLPRLRMWVTTGEAIAPELFERFRREMPHAELHNLYGASEASSVAWWTPPAATAALARVPIGQATSYAELWVLDRYRQPAPIGVPGELYIGGSALARGYVNRPALTAERFVPHPWAAAGARLYRSGDRARLLADGTVEYFGRLDRQLKLRGFRVEPGEIEAALLRHACLLQTAVEVRGGRDGEARLVAYLVERDTVSDRELRDHLRTLLPAWMVPAAFVRLPTLPLTASGKLDRRALPEPIADSTPLSAAEAPADPLELQLKLIWESLLDRRPIGVHDEFWDLGGHSLLAVRLVAEIEEGLGRGVPLSAIFQAPTVAGLAALLRAGWSPPWASLTAMQPGGGKPPLFWVPPAGSTIASFVDLARHIGDEQPFYAFQPRGFAAGEIPDTRVDEMARHYVHEMRLLQPVGPYLLGGKCFGGRVAFEMARQLTAAGQQVALLVMHDTTPRGPMPSTSVDRYRSRLTYWRERGDLTGALARKAQRLTTRLQRRIRGRFGSDADRRIQRVRDAHALASRTYTPLPYGGRVTILWSSEFFELRGAIGNDGWGRLSAGVDSEVVPGRHHELLQEPLAARFAERLRACIDAALGDVEPRTKD